MELFVWVLLFLTPALADEVLVVFDYNLDSNVTEINANFNSSGVTKCEREHEFDKMSIGKVLGKWKLVELYMHLSKEGVHSYKSCPEITIWVEKQFPSSTFGPSTENQLFHVQHINAKFRQEYRHLRLLWDEEGKTSEYSLYFRNDSAGYWQVFDGQTGSLAAQPSYQQFSGTIQVLKAVHDHLVLNFCQEANSNRPAQLYSLLLSRDPGTMRLWEIESVHNLLQTKKLSVASRRMVCGNSGGKLIYSYLSTLLLLVLSYMVSS